MTAETGEASPPLHGLRDKAEMLAVLSGLWTEPKDGTYDDGIDLDNMREEI